MFVIQLGLVMVMKVEVVFELVENLKVKIKVR